MELLVKRVHSSQTLWSLYSVILCTQIYSDFFPATSPCVYLDQRPGDSRTVADLCLPGWVQASCCFFSPRVLWHLSLFTCSVMVIRSDRVSSLSLLPLSFCLFFLSLPPFHLSFSRSFRACLSFSSKPRCSFRMCTVSWPVAAVGAAQKWIELGVLWDR